jgi:type III secretion protein U
VAQDNDSGDKTEQPTPKKLQDARKKGDVPKSRDLTSMVTMLVAALLILLSTGWAANELAGLMQAALQLAHQPLAAAGPRLAEHAVWVVLALSCAVLVPMAALGVITEFLQAGPVFAMEKLKPKLENMNPVEGIKRMFKLDALIELAKTVVKTVFLLAIGVLAVLAIAPDLIRLPTATHPQALGYAMWAAAKPILLWTTAVMVLLAFLDAAYQRWSFTKKMRMSLRDIRQEIKESEGDPMVKQQRRQAHEEWSQRNATTAASQANVLVVNPTHVAIAIEYDRETCPVPTIAAKGEDHVARAMREAAQDAGVPVVRNVTLARDLLARAEVGELVPADLFDVIAEVVLWAREVRDELAELDRTPDLSDAPDPPPARPPRRRRAPGEDLTRYPGRPEPVESLA